MLDDGVGLGGFGKQLTVIRISLLKQPVILKRRKISPLPLTTPFSFDALFYSSLSSLQKDIFQISS